MRTLEIQIRSAVQTVQLHFTYKITVSSRTSQFTDYKFIVYYILLKLMTALVKDFSDMVGLQGFKVK